MKTVSLRQYADAVGYWPKGTENKPVGPKPINVKANKDPVTLADLRVKPMKGNCPASVQNAFVRRQFLEAIRSYMSPILNNDKLRTVEYGRYETAKKFMKIAERKLVGKEVLYSNLEKGTVLALFKGVKGVHLGLCHQAQFDKESFHGHVLSQEDRDLLLEAREILPEAWITEVDLPKTTSLPVRPAKKTVKPSSKTVKFSSAPQLASSKKTSKPSANTQKKFKSAPLPAASKPNGFVAFFKSLFGWLSPKSSKQK